MTYSSGVDPVDAQVDGRVDASEEAGWTGWTGWLAFAGMMMVMLGSFHAFQGFVALLDDDYYLVPKSGLTIHVDYTAWGWIHLVLGSIIALAGFGLLAGQMWARIVAVLTALVSAVVNVAFLAAFPVWSSIMIVLDIVIIWAVMVHGREMKSDY
jgi:hypothetical protein